MPDTNPLIQASTIDTLSNVRCMLVFIADLHRSVESEWHDGTDANLGAYLSLRCAEQAIHYEISRLQQTQPLKKEPPSGGEALV